MEAGAGISGLLCRSRPCAARVSCRTVLRMVTTFSYIGLGATATLRGRVLARLWLFLLGRTLVAGFLRGCQVGIIVGLDGPLGEIMLFVVFGRLAGGRGRILLWSLHGETHKA